jgi:hypothetical protein
MTMFVPGKLYRTTTMVTDNVFLVLSAVPVRPSQTFADDDESTITILHVVSQRRVTITTFQAGQIELYKCQEVLP